MADRSEKPNIKRLQQIAVAAIAIALLGSYLFWRQIQTGNMGWVGILICATLALIIYAISFYIGVMSFERKLEGYIVSDTFKKKNDWVDVETETRSSDDASIDAWVKHYVFTRAIFAMGILPLIASIYIFWFA